MKKLYLIPIFLFVIGNLSIASELSQKNNLLDLTSDLNSSLTMTVTGQVAPGYLLLTPSVPATSVPAFASIAILDSVGKVLKTAPAKSPRDLKFTREGRLQFLETVDQFTGWGTAQLVYTDKNLNRLDTLKWKNQFKFGFHDAIVLRNGNRLVIGFDPNQIDVSGMVTGGRPDYDIQGSFIQEINPEGKVVFQWRSFDNIPITDSYNDLLVNNNSYSHINSIDEDFDGNFIASFRNLSQIVKINRITGDIMWRMGGKKSDFTYVGFNEPVGGPQISYQHDVRMLGNRMASVFDNGNQYNPRITKAKVIKIDELAKTVTLLREYAHPNKLYTSNQGNVQLFSNNNALMSWGSANNTQTIAFTEIDKDNNIILQGELPKNTANYRVVKQDIDGYCKVNTTAFDEFKKFNTYKVRKDNLPFVDITIDEYKGMLYNNLEFSYSECFNDKLRFEPGREPAIIGPYFQITPYQHTEFEATLTFYQESNPEFRENKQLSLYFKAEGDSIYRRKDTLVPGSTSMTKFTISGITSGRFVIGYPAAGFEIPKISLMQPVNNSFKKIGSKVDFSWNIQGSQIDSAKIQIVKDTNNPNQSIVSEFKVTETITNDVFSESGEYYWRVIASNLAGTGVSKFNKFSVGDDYIKVTYPNTSATFSKDNEIALRWETNLNPDYKLSLVSDNNTSYTITNTGKMKTGGTLLKLDATKFPPGKYKFKIEAEGKSDMSDEYFEIPVTSVETAKSEVFEVFPNPTTDGVTIKNINGFKLENIAIINSAGQIVRNIRNTLGSSDIFINLKDLESGSYILMLDFDGKQEIRKLIVN